MNSVNVDPKVVEVMTKLREVSDVRLSLVAERCGGGESLVDLISTWGHGFLGYGFEWSSSPEGQEYWSNIHNSLYYDTF